MAKKSAYKCPSCNTVLLLEKKSNDQSISCPNCGNRHSAGDYMTIRMQRVFCPSCNTGLRVSAEYTGILACPKCRRRSDISEFSQHPRQSTQPTTDEELSQVSLRRSYLKGSGQTGKLILTEGNCTPNQINLNIGANTIGRKSVSISLRNTATIQLESDDYYMSKRHAHIDVIIREDQSLEYHLSDAESSNGTWHNGKRLGRDEIVTLQAGDKIRIGVTVFEFVV